VGELSVRKTKHEYLLKELNVEVLNWREAVACSARSTGLFSSSMFMDDRW